MSGGGPTRQDTHKITVSIADPDDPTKMLDYGVWDKMTGGEIDSAETLYYPGAMAPPVSLGGRRTVGNITVSRLYRLYRDHTHLGKLFDSAGKMRAVVQRHALDINGNVFKDPIIYNCTLKKVAPPDLDSEQSGAALLELEFTVDGFPHVTTELPLGAVPSPGTVY